MVSEVVWCRDRVDVLASCSDDGSVRVWVGGWVGEEEMVRLRG